MGCYSASCLVAPGSSPATQFGGKTCLLSACGPDLSAAPGDRGGRWPGLGCGRPGAPFSLFSSSPHPPAVHPSWIFCWCRLLNLTPVSRIITIFPATRRRGGRALSTPEGLSFLVFTLSHSNLGVSKALRSLTVVFLCCPWGPATPLLHFRVSMGKIILSSFTVPD